MNQLSSNTPLTDKLIAENSIFCDSDNLCKLRDHACILELRILAKDKLIEQMRDAITEALAEEQCPAKEYWQTVETKHHRGECWHAKARAALSAAERITK